jgi:large subunit ribosomal protein L11
MNKNAKKVETAKTGNHTIRLHIKGGMANAAPPIGPALSQWKVNIMGFCKAFNDQTQDKKGIYLPVDIYVKQGGAFTFEVHQERTSDTIRKLAGLEKGSSTPGREKTRQQIKFGQLLDLAKSRNASATEDELNSIARTYAGTARSMGLEVIQ